MAVQDVTLTVRSCSVASPGAVRSAAGAAGPTWDAWAGRGTAECIPGCEASPNLTPLAGHPAKRLEPKGGAMGGGSVATGWVRVPEDPSATS